MRIPVISRLAVMAALGAVAATGTAQAATWDFSGSGGLQALGATMTFGTLQARAYVVDTNNGSANIATTDVLNSANGTTTIQAAQIGQYSSGLGVSATGQGADNTTNSPEHTMDNQLGFEFLVFKLPDNQAFTSLQLDSFSGGSGTGTGDADITAWIGGDDISDFSYFAGKTFGSLLGSPNTTSLSGSRFAQLNLKTSSTCATTGEGTNAAGNSAGCNDVVYTLDTPNIEQPGAPAGADAAGKWLIVAAAMTVNGSNLIADRDDDVKITKITTTTQTPPPPGTASEPGTLAMLLAGAGYAFWRRRRNGTEGASTED
jgi:hypothetical protein